MTKQSKPTAVSGSNSTVSLVFFGNEKLVTGVTVRPIIQQALLTAGFTIEKTVTGPLSELGSHTSPIAVLAAYGHIIPQKILDQFPSGIINIHPSLLPLYRGPTPIESAILDGVTKTGVSVMKLTAGMDEGPLYKQRSLPLDGTESKHELSKKLQQMGADMLVELLPGIANRTIRPRSQPHPDRATYSRKLTKQDGTLDFYKTPEVLEREVRAFAEWPKSRTSIIGIDAVITKAAPEKATSGEPGTVFRTASKQLGIYCKTGALMITELKPAGKQAMTAEAFLAGHASKIPLLS
jgi:methionyl-tRNA formyltransferase